MRSNEKSGLWFAKMIAGVAISGLMLIHFIVNHSLVPGGLLSYADVIRYYQNTIVVVMEVVFLSVLMFHVVLGLRSILMDLDIPDSWIKAATWIMSVVGVGAVIYGVWLALTIASRTPA